MTDKPRLIEHAFPLKQASLDSVHEKNVRHGHISTLHIWPARRPLAACRAALIATLLPDPGTPEERLHDVDLIGVLLPKKPEHRHVQGGVEHRPRREPPALGISKRPFIAAVPAESEHLHLWEEAAQVTEDLLGDVLAVP